MSVHLSNPGKRKYDTELDQESFSRFIADLPYMPIDILEIVKELVDGYIQNKYLAADVILKEAWEHVELEREPTIRELKKYRLEGRKRVSWGISIPATRAIRELIKKPTLKNLFLILSPPRPQTDCGTVLLTTQDDLDGLVDYGFEWDLS